MNRGERDIKWMKLGGFAVLTFTMVPLILELIWYRLSGRWSGEVLLVAGFVSSLIVLRSLLRAFSIPECELNLRPMGVAPLPEDPQPVDPAEVPEKESVVLPC